MPLPFQRRGGAQLRPTFSRDFAGLKTLDHGTGPAITFTRASNATFFSASGVLQTASNDQPRFDHDPATGASRGLLIEEARTNLLERSAEFDNAYWTKTESSVDANAIAAPDGTTSAEKLKTNTNSAEHSVVRLNMSVTSGLAYTTSVFAKKAERDILFINFSSAGFTTPSPSFFNLTTGTATAGASVTASMVDVGNGWYRCSATKTATATTAINSVRIGVTESTASSTSTGANSTDGLYIWGAQHEQGAFPTSYIPTTAAAATRSADSAVVTPISSFYNQAEGTFVAEASYTGKVPSAFSRILSFGNTTAGDPDRWFWGFNDANTDHLIQHFTAGVFDFGTSFTTSAGTVYKAASAIALNNARAARNGSLLGANDDATVGAPGNKTHMVLAASPGGLTSGGHHFRRIAYYPRRLSNTLLEQLTT